MESTPAPVQSFLVALAKRVPSLQPKLEQGGEKAGNWWIDVSGPKPITVEWRPEFGFGFSVEGAGGYGEGPAEIFRSPARAAHRVAQLLAAPSVVAPTGLRAIRELYGVTQKQIASRMKKQQPAVARLETRSDFKIETIGKFVQALGGHVEVRAVFPDGHFPIYAAKKTKAKQHGSTKSRRLARA